MTRELWMRKALYPRWVTQGKKSQAWADREIGAMEAVLLTLKQYVSMSTHMYSVGEGGRLIELKAPEGAR